MEVILLMIIEGAAEGFGGYLIIRVIELIWKMFVEFFMNLKKFVTSINIAASVKTVMGNRNVIVRGVFNRNTGKYVEKTPEVVLYGSIDSKLSNAHGDNTVVVWNNLLR